MKGSEALLRTIAAEGGRIEATQLQIWLSKLIESGYIETVTDGDSESVFFYELTDKSKELLKQKGVTL